MKIGCGGLATWVVEAMGGYIPGLKEILCQFNSTVVLSQAHRCEVGRPIHKWLTCARIWVKKKRLWWLKQWRVFVLYMPFLVP